MTKELLHGGSVEAHPVTAVDDILTAIEAELAGFLSAKLYPGGEPPFVAAAAEHLLVFVRAGGKRLRPLLCWAGWLAAGGEGEDRSIVRVAASLELFHAFALIHDDIMDCSDLRRGRTTMHRSLESLYIGRRTKSAEVARFGVNLAILIGDLAFVWSDELLHSSGLDQSQLAWLRPELDAMRCEVMAGQYLDLVNTGVPARDVATALAIARLKTAKYTVERPMRLGAAIRSPTPEILRYCSDFGIPVGEAFQLRDDLIGVFGDPVVTGKSRLEDLREGKCTTLVTLARQAADARQREILDRLIGNPHFEEQQAGQVRRILRETGAVDGVKAMIAGRLQTGLDALERAPFPDTAKAVLREFAHAAAIRGR